jgi:hypothetical protein
MRGREQALGVLALGVVVFWVAILTGMLPRQHGTSASLPTLNGTVTPRPTADPSATPHPWGVATLPNSDQRDGALSHSGSLTAVESLAAGGAVPTASGGSMPTASGGAVPTASRGAVPTPSASGAASIAGLALPVGVPKVPIPSPPVLPIPTPTPIPHLP